MSWIRRTTLFACLPLVLLTLVPVGADGQETVANLDVMGTLTGEVIAALLADMPGDMKGRELTLVPYARDERYEFIGNVFSRILTTNGYRIIVSGPPVARDSTGVETIRARRGLQLEYQATDFSLSYPKFFRSKLIGGKKVKRSARVSLLARVVDPSDRSVVWVGEAAENHQDQFPHKHLPQVETGLFTFAQPQHPGGRLGKVVEPVVVSGIIVGLIYLFFSNQDNN